MLSEYNWFPVGVPLFSNYLSMGTPALDGTFGLAKSRFCSMLALRLILACMITTVAIAPFGTIVEKIVGTLHFA